VNPVPFGMGFCFLRCHWRWSDAPFVLARGGVCGLPVEIPFRSVRITPSKSQNKNDIFMFHPIILIFTLTQANVLTAKKYLELNYPLSGKVSDIEAFLSIRRNRSQGAFFSNCIVGTATRSC
jgi:hypothetical protein